MERSWVGRLKAPEEDAGELMWGAHAKENQGWVGVRCGGAGHSKKSESCPFHLMHSLLLSVSLRPHLFNVFKRGPHAAADHS